MCVCVCVWVCVCVMVCERGRGSEQFVLPACGRRPRVKERVRVRECVSE